MSKAPWPLKKGKSSIFMSDPAFTSGAWKAWTRKTRYGERRDTSNEAWLRFLENYEAKRAARIAAKGSKLLDIAGRHNVNLAKNPKGFQIKKDKVK